MLIKAGLIAFGAILLVVLALTLLFKFRANEEEENPYAANRRKVEPREIAKEDNIVNEDKYEEVEQREDIKPNNSTDKGRDIGPKPKNFKL